MVGEDAFHEGDAGSHAEGVCGVAALCAYLGDDVADGQERLLWTLVDHAHRHFDEVVGDARDWGRR
ncbi:hypothetical protein ACF1GS_18570 [Streptomyces eurythermus]|uniref:hypothetical protein n=1 Tax=Streptomyces eurythermus TaxID=42237 RepID=UPI0036FBA816